MGMQVLCAHNVPSSTRGFVTRYFIEVSPGVYVGGLNKGMVDELWKLLSQPDYYGRGYLIMVESAPRTPQNFTVREAGTGSRVLVRIDSFWFLNRGRVR